MSGERRYVVVGAVAAGMSAASHIRRREPRAKVVVLERGPHVSYDICAIPHSVRDPAQSTDDLVVLDADRARDERDIHVRLRCRATAVDLDRGVVVVHDDEEEHDDQESFDALVLATGARPIRLQLDGFELPGVLMLRDLTDAVALKRTLGERSARRAVVVGGGCLGLEMAAALAARSLAVTVVERQPRLLPGWSDATVQAVGEALATAGIDVHTGAGAEGAEAGSDGHLAAVWADGKRLECDVALVAVGVRPNVTLASDAGLRLGDSGALWVNHYQQTSHEAVWAAGSCCEAHHRILRKNDWVPLDSTAHKQGRVAGANASGERQRFRGIVGTRGFVVAGLQVARTGLDAERARDEGFEPVEVSVRQRSRGAGIPGSEPLQVTLVADGPTGLLLGGEVTGRDGAALRVNVLAGALSSHLSVADLQQLDLVYSPPVAPVWDPLLVAANELAKRIRRA